jgi:ribosomal silencing factor RsfS
MIQASLVTLRDRYRLEVLWGEAPRLELDAQTGAGGRAAEG